MMNVKDSTGIPAKEYNPLKEAISVVRKNVNCEKHNYIPLVTKELKNVEDELERNKLCKLNLVTALVCSHCLKTVFNHGLYREYFGEDL